MIFNIIKRVELRISTIKIVEVSKTFRTIIRISTERENYLIHVKTCNQSILTYEYIRNKHDFQLLLILTIEIIIFVAILTEFLDIFWYLAFNFDENVLPFPDDTKIVSICLRYL